MVQNHLLQLLCLIAMEPPSNLRPESLRGEKVKVLRSLRPIADAELAQKTVRGQYTRGVADGKTVPGYAEEEGGKASDTETFVALCAHLDNWRWAGVPFYLRTGKRLPKRSSQIVIEFRDVPHSIFNGSPLMANRLTITLQPEEAISLTIMNKTPTLTLSGYELQPLALNLSLLDAFKGEKRRFIAYERLLLATVANDSTLFVGRDEADAAWVWIDRIIEGWARTGMKPAPYPAGSWGPAGAFALTERNGHSWYE
jgi:glucose-6-phosphate 1-dehydrogenase